MKRILSILAILVTITMFSACSSKSGEASKNVDSTSTVVDSVAVDSTLEVVDTLAITL